VGFFQWSTTANLNASIDPLINFSAQMAPSSVGPSNRNVMSVLAGYRNDTSGAMRDAGVTNAYVLSSASNYNQMTGSQTALQTLGNNSISFTPINTNTGPSTISIDGLGPFALRTAPNTELLPGSLVGGSPYGCVYNATDNAFYLHGFFGQQSIPIGASLEFWGTTAPFSNYALMFGQQISQTTFATLYALFGPNRFGTDTSSLFFLPDCRGRAVFGVDNMGGTAAGRLTTASGMGTGQLGQTGGAETETLTAAQIPSITSFGTNNVASTSTGAFMTGNFATTPEGTSGPSIVTIIANGAEAVIPVASNGTASINSTSDNTSGAAHNNMVPALCANRILRIA
jgi:microcystin-dependent protein